MKMLAVPLMLLFILPTPASTKTSQVGYHLGLPKIAAGSILAVGDIHGAQQIPHYSIELVDHMAAQGALVVGVELARDSEAVDCATRQTPLPTSWTLPAADGRTSAAVRDLLCHLRTLRDQRRVRIVYLDGTQRQRGFDALAAMRVADALADVPGARALVVAGNYHTRNVGSSLAGSLRMRGFHVTTATISSADRNAQVWQCQQDGCGKKQTNVNLCSGQPDDAAGAKPQKVSWTRVDNSPWDYCITMPRLSASVPFASLQRTVVAQANR